MNTKANLRQGKIIFKKQLLKIKYGLCRGAFYNVFYNIDRECCIVERDEARNQNTWI